MHVLCTADLDLSHDINISDAKVFPDLKMCRVPAGSTRTGGIIPILEAQRRMRCRLASSNIHLQQCHLVIFFPSQAVMLVPNAWLDCLLILQVFVPTIKEKADDSEFYRSTAPWRALELTVCLTLGW